MGKGDVAPNSSSLSFAKAIHGIFRPNFDMELIAELS
jgi:hypothetical protein